MVSAKRFLPDGHKSAGREEGISVRTYLFWCYLMMKRMIKKPAYLLLLLALPILSAAMMRLEQSGDDSAGVTVGILFEKEGQTEIPQDDKEWNQKFFTFLSEQDSVIQFRLYEKSASLLRDIEKGELDCGVVVPVEIRERIMTDLWQGSITVYKTSSTSVTEIVKERIASAVFTFYSEESYVNYVENSNIFQETVEANSDRTEEIREFAVKAYETHLTDGSTFAFQYHGESYDNNTEEQVTDTANPGFRLKGVLAVCIFLSGLCGLLTDWNDRRERRFVRMAPEWVTTAVNIWVPTIYTSVISLLSLLLAGQITGIGKELCHLVFYQFLIVVYCSIIRVIIRKQEQLAAAIPILTLASIVCCPVWIRLAVYLPVFHVLEKLFPVTYYLMM